MEITEQQLKQFDGSDPSKPIYVAVKGRIFDVSSGKSFYGAGGSYCMFAGKDASRALAKMSKNEEDISASLHALSEKEMGVLNDWEKKFEAKYPVVGRVLFLKFGMIIVSIECNTLEIIEVVALKLFVLPCALVKGGFLMIDKPLLGFCRIDKPYLPANCSWFAVSALLSRFSANQHHCNVAQWHHMKPQEGTIAASMVQPET
ncbi:hypothetical protein HHK36_021227 [Tetracentron sinense]|uniref:Cytochrome b5 heme-binding domain-containing protein n=1 Tax=Tetracentron sinense TaxID=13715 RepID=A0A835D7M0_TETSI|nr:hypothetical protein HHK36_021227 [Tetracentron sinense]